MSATTIQNLSTPAPSTSEVPLTAHDRCSGCGAQAYVRVDTEMLGEFLFCGHHWAKSEPGLALATPFKSVWDERHKLEPKPYDPSTDND